ncbi:unnamed protein product [Linum tenue]|uniref:Lysine-specific demethylase JMJ25 n=1 Tax=Linum tenue TaxID=586396 RepID=A0AAV0LBB7_9ROSI|nr:unnamed protein product [Linum tenue]
MAENGPLPDHLRCKRTDGRRWRCGRKVLPGKKLCEIHHLQGKHRQHKWKVPESLKIQREYKNRNKISNGARVRLQKEEADVVLSKLGQKRKKSEGFEEVVKMKKKKKMKKKVKAKKNTLQFELIRMVLKREVEKRKGQSTSNKKPNSKSKSGSSDNNGGEEGEEDDEDEEPELMRDLPNGFMAISPVKHFNNVGSCSASAASCDVKIGSDSSSGIRFRSKNLEPLPIGAALQVKDMVELRRGKKKQKCHWCRKNGLSSTLIQCSSCSKEFFCTDCIKDRYFDEQEEVQNACPVCRGTCGCKPCLAGRFKDSDCEEYSNGGRQVNKVLHFHYMICMLLPVLKQMNRDLVSEIDTEAKMKGLKPSEVQIELAKVSSNQRSCNKCKASIVDFHRSCQICSYNLCLRCCRDVFQGIVCGNVDVLVSKCPTRRKTFISGKQQCEVISAFTSKKRLPGRCPSNRKAFNGCVGIPCPSSEFGGCGDSLLDLSSLFPLSWAKELETSAEELIGCYELPETLDINSSCSLCTESDLDTDEIRQSQEASAREDSQDNLLYCPTAAEIHGDNLEHFQKHWGKGQPVKVRNVLLGTSDLSWDPIVMFCTYLKNNANTPGNTQATDSLDHFEVEIGVRQLFMGSIRGPKKANMWHEDLKLKGWLSSQVIQEHLPAHFSEILHALPLPEYMDPASGLLNVAAELPQEISKPDLGPSIYISYNSGNDIVRADSVSKLRYDTYDVVNVLVHATDAPVSTEQLNYIRKLMKKNKEENRANGGSIEELGLHDLVEEEVQLHKKVARVSWFSAAAAAAQHEACDEKPEAAFHNNGACSDTDSDTDTDTDTDTEVSKFFFGPVKGSRTSDHRPSRIKHTETTSDEEFVSEKHEESCGVLWDVFRRQDVPKLVEYLRLHSKEFVETYGSRKPVTHPIHDQIFFLDAVHKRRLKEEFEIEPWSFEQHVGEAVIVPAGCPYQIRNLKSCVNIVLDFVSPESVVQSMQLIDELRLLPDKHKARADSLEVKQMAIHGVSRAIKEIRDLTS